jgi:hypothetical protein
VSVSITTVAPNSGDPASSSLFGDRVVTDLNALAAAVNSLKFAVGNTTSFTLTTGGTEQMVSSPATGFVWKAGRAYRISLTGRAGNDTNGGEDIFKLRRGTTTAASVLADFGSIKVVNTGNLHHVNLMCYVKNATGADITTTVQPSLVGSGVTKPTWDGASVPRGWMIEDIGDASALGALAIDI